MKRLLLFFCLTALFIYGCANSREKEEEQILESIAVQYIDINKEDIEHLESVLREDSSYNTSIIVSVSQMEDYKGYKTFYISPDFNLYSYRVPTYFMKKGNRYIAIYLKGRKSFEKNNIPGFLFKESKTQFLIEGGCHVIMCKECNKSIAIDICENISYSAIRQTENLPLRCDHKWNGKVKIEDAIIDRCELPPPPEEIHKRKRKK